jgi:hypothetical protein
MFMVHSYSPLVLDALLPPESQAIRFRHVFNYVYIDALMVNEFRTIV